MRLWRVGGSKTLLFLFVESPYGDLAGGEGMYPGGGAVQRARASTAHAGYVLRWGGSVQIQTWAGFLLGLGQRQ